MRAVLLYGEKNWCNSNVDEVHLENSGCKNLWERVHRVQRDKQTREDHQRWEGRPVHCGPQRVGQRADGWRPGQESLLEIRPILCVKSNKCFKFCWSSSVLFLQPKLAEEEYVLCWYFVCLQKVELTPNPRGLPQIAMCQHFGFSNIFRWRLTSWID